MCVKMYRQLVIVLILLCMVFVDGKKCKKETDCSENECCVIFGYKKNSIGECRKLRKEGSRCSRISDKLRMFGGKYVSICPCEAPFDCKDKKDINSKRKYFRCVNETHNASCEYIKTVKQIVKRDSPYGSKENLENDDTDSSYGEDKGLIQSQDTIDESLGDILQDDETSDAVKKSDYDTDENLKAMWEKEIPVESTNLKQDSEQEKPMEMTGLKQGYQLDDDDQSPMYEGSNEGIFNEDDAGGKPKLSEIESKLLEQQFKKIIQDDKFSNNQQTIKDKSKAHLSTVDNDGGSLNRENSYEDDDQGKEVVELSHSTIRPLKVDQHEAILNSETTPNYEHILKYLQKMVGSKNKHGTKDAKEGSWAEKGVVKNIPKPSDADASFNEDRLNKAGTDAPLPDETRILAKKYRDEVPEEKLATDSPKNVKPLQSEMEVDYLQHMYSSENDEDALNDEYEDGSLGEEKSFVKEKVPEEDMPEKISLEEDRNADYMDEIE